MKKFIKLLLMLAIIIGFCACGGGSSGGGTTTAPAPEEDEEDKIPPETDIQRSSTRPQATDLGFKVFVITNQSGIARGLYSAADLQAVHSKMLAQLQQGGATLDEVLHCPHHPQGTVPQLSVKCQCRKPGNLFFRQLQKKYSLRARASFMIGDKASDIGFGKNSGLQTILVRTGEGEQTFRAGNANPDFVVDDLLAAAKLIKRLSAQEAGDYAR